MRRRSGRHSRGSTISTGLSLAGTLSGLAIPTQRNLQLTPYILGKTYQEGSLTSGSKQNGDIGFDLKYSVTPSLTLDATYNTDFAQVEVDTQQINFDRFNLFFPEKRPFFLENAGLFSVGIGGEAEVFFSRAIGIGSDNLPIPIVGGGRLTGRIASNTSIGIINMQTAEETGARPVGQQFQRCARAAGVAEPLSRRRDLREPPGDRRPCRRS